MQRWQASTKTIYTGRAAAKTMIAKISIASCSGVILLASALLGAEKAPVISGAKETFAVRPSPWEDRLLLYSLHKEVEGESAAYVSGPLVSVSKAGNSWLVREMKTIAGDMDSGSIAWTKSSAYATSTKGIVRLRSGAAPERIYSGKAAGLAVSKDGAFLAFWQFSDKTDTLIALRVSDRRVMRRWRRPYHLQTESSGWELAFAPDGKSILARTYDEEDDNHLKSFNLRTGAMTTLLDGCNSIVQSGDGIFVFGGQGERKGLYQLSGGELQFLTHIEDEDSLTPTAQSDMVVVTDAFKKHLLIYDVAKHASKEVDGCSDATVLKSGQQLFFRAGKIFLDPAECTQ
jgi:hypothetical protein